MRLVYDDRKLSRAVLASDLVEYEWKLLHGGNDDFLALGDELAKIARVFRVSNGRTHLRELFDCVPDLLVENAPVGHHDYRVEYRSTALRKADHLMRQPCDRVRLAAPSGMLDQVALACSVLPRVG